jgi:di/tricarboxylate transporter
MYGSWSRHASPGGPGTPCMMTALPAVATTALAIFACVFATATVRGVHLGLLMFVAACVVGPTLAGMPLGDVVAGFPVGILVLVAGVTFFFGIAQMNGTLERVMGAMLARMGGHRAAMPVLFFVLAAVMAAMGSPQAGLATGPVGMSTARRARVDPVLMAIAVNSGICAGAFAPTSLFGVITYGIAGRAGIEVSAAELLGVAVMSNLALLVGALLLFSRRGGELDSERVAPVEATDPSSTVAATTPGSGRMSLQQMTSVACLIGLAPAIITSTLVGAELDIGVVLLGLGAALALLDPTIGARAFARIDWSTAFVVGGIVTYVGVLQKLDAVNLLGREAMTIGTPFVAALVICIIAALVSAFASTTGVLAALVPMAVPLAASGAVPGWVLITTLGVSATIVDVSPFSNTGATLIVSAPDQDRPRLRVMLLRWSMAMVLVGPLVLLPALLAFAR